jgi:hypothetical protein
MNINEVLEGRVNTASKEEQKIVLDQMKEQKIFDLSDEHMKNLIDFLCENVDKELSIDYLFHVLDTEISYPIDDDKVKRIFTDKRMSEMKDMMMQQLQDEDVDEFEN